MLTFKSFSPSETRHHDTIPNPLSTKRDTPEDINKHSIKLIFIFLPNINNYC